MAYKIKKGFFFLLAIFNCPYVLYWCIYIPANLFSPIRSILKKLDLWSWFHGDTVIGPAVVGMILCTVSAVIFLIFYRKECSLCPKLMLTFTGVVICRTSSDILGEINYALIRNIAGNAATIYQAVLVFYALFALATLIWLIVSLVQYPKAPKKQSAT